MMQDIIYKLFSLNRTASLSVFNLLVNLKGLDCKVTPPVRTTHVTNVLEHGLNTSIFGLEDLTDYETETDSYNKKLLLFNIIQEGSQGMQDYDTFLTSAFCLTTYEDRFPLQTLIKVNFLGKDLEFKVDDHKNLFPTVESQLFIKNILVPAT